MSFLGSFNPLASRYEKAKIGLQTAQGELVACQKKVKDAEIELENAEAADSQAPAPSGTITTGEDSLKMGGRKKTRRGGKKSRRSRK